MLTQVGKYQIVEKIGVGGFGSVYKGRDPFIKRAVAIKTCQSDEEEIKKRFFREAEFAGNLHHRNITTIYDFGVTEEGVPYIVQEFLTGEDLDKKIKQKEPLPLARKIRILLDVCEGLGYAHAQGIVHRDIKPSNVRVLEDGTVKIMDFGIAKSMVSQSTLTQTGITLGTASYLAPEQIRGETIDPRTDIFSLGVLAYELFTLQKPFTGDHISTVLYKILNEQPPPPSELDPAIPPGLGQAVMRAIEKDRTNRFASCQEMRDELVAIADGVSAEVSDAVRSAAILPPSETEKTVSTPSGGFYSMGGTAHPIAPRPGTRSVGPESVRLSSPGLSAPPPGATGSIGDVRIREEGTFTSPISAPVQEGSGALRIFLASLALLAVVAVGVAYLHFQVGVPLPGKKTAPTPETPATGAETPSSASTDGESTSAPPTTLPAPTAVPTPEPKPTAAAEGYALFSSNYYAELSIDGQRRKGGVEASTRVSLKPGRHRAVFSTAGGLPNIERVFDVKPGESTPVRAEFPPRGELRIEVDFGARDTQFYLDGSSIGRAPLKRFVKAGPHRLEGVLAGYQTHEETVVVPEQDLKKVQIVMKKKEGAAP